MEQWHQGRRGIVMATRPLHPAPAGVDTGRDRCDEGAQSAVTGRDPLRTRRRTLSQRRSTEMKNWAIAMIVALALALPASGRAHEGHTHKALGTISSVQGEHVDIKTNDGKTISVLLDKKTTVTRGKDKLDATALKVGERVSVEYMEANKILTAHAFKLGTTTQSAKK